MKGASRAQLAAQLADRCDEVSALRAALAAVTADRDDWQQIARALLDRNAELSRDRVVIVTEPTGQQNGKSTALYRAAARQTRGRG